MSFLKHFLFIYLPSLLIMAALCSSSALAEHRLGISGGTAILYGDLQSSSDPGPSVMATYLYSPNRYFGLGLEGGVSKVSGESEIVYSSARYYGVHPYETTIIPLGLFARLEIPGSRVRPFIEGSAGVAVWFPGKQNPDAMLPTEERISSSVNPAGSLGGGLMFVLNKNWAFELGGRARYILSDALDNVDGDIIGTDDPYDDHLIEGGLKLVYLFGGEKPAPKRPPVQAPPVRKPREAVAEKPPAAVPVVSDRDHDGIPDSRDGAPDDPEDMDGFMDDDGVPDPDNDGDGIPDVSDPEPNSPREMKPPVMEQAVRGYSVHVSSFRTLSRANAEMTRLGGRGIQSFAVLTAIPGKGDMYRVYAGMYDTIEEARQAGDALMKNGTVKYINPVKLDPGMDRIMPGMVDIFLHVASFRTERKAMQEAEKFSQSGYPVTVMLFDLGEKGVWNRVLIGPFGTRKEAQKAAGVLKAWKLIDNTAIIETMTK